MLEVRSLCAWWGSAQALFDVSLTVQGGELVVLQGLNGAGKSTLLQSLIGIGPRCMGTINYQNPRGTADRIDAWPAHRRAHAGLGFVAEDRRLFTALTVQENLLVAARQARPGNPTVQQQLVGVLDLFPALHGMLMRPAGQMSGGEQQMLAIARTLMTQPAMLLLDEPCEGVAPVLVAAIRDGLLRLKAQGMPMLVAEQNRILASRADRVIKLTSGKISP
jgi:branched-chain amino acid transport system ATP-binding protein